MQCYFFGRRVVDNFKYPRHQLIINEVTNSFRAGQSNLFHSDNIYSSSPPLFLAPRFWVPRDLPQPGSVLVVREGNLETWLEILSSRFELAWTSVVFRVFPAVFAAVFARLSFKNFFMLSVLLWSYGCTREVWRARKIRNSCSRRSKFFCNIADKNACLFINS